MRVLIVEDTPDEAELFADLVAHHGHDPIVAASAEAALDSLATARKDPDGQAYAFVNLTNADFTRLKNFVDAGLQARPSG